MSDPVLLETIRAVRGRWKLALVLRGVAIFIGAMLLLIALSALGFAQWGFATTTVVTARLIVAVVALAVFGVVVLWPALRRISDETVALYIEEREPELQAILISAIETPSAQNGLTRPLVERAAAQCRAIGFGQRIEQRRINRHSYVLAASVLAALLIVGAGPPAMRHAARILLLPTPAAEAAAVMSIAVLPGNDTIARGSDIALKAELRAFSAGTATIAVRGAGKDWQRWPMQEGQKTGTFEAVLFDVSEVTEYYVESEAVRSPTYRIDVVDAPFVRGLTLDYQFPAYTGLKPKRVTNGGDIVAPLGTIVRIIAATSSPVSEGRLQLDDARAIRMQPDSAGALTAALRITHDGLYHVQLPGIDGQLTNASAQHAITAIPDRPPHVTIEKPGRDIKVTAVDEVFVSASAEDDYGVARLQLLFSVNGGPNQTLPLTTPSGAHTFFLEELSLKPGDFVSYFVRATDNNALTGAQSSTTDIYFIQIKPFSRDYRAAEQMSGAGGGQGEEGAGALSERQRQIIAATFNVSRDRPTYTAQGYAEAITTIELSQRKLREQVNTLVQRMQMRGVVGMDSIFAQIAEMLPQATKEMGAAEERLQQRKPDDALGPEQRALQQLLRAEALYREVQVQMQQQQAGSSATNPPEDLADLFELERDQLRNQYETVQRSQQEQTQRQVDEALERLRELARRQQQEADRQRQAAASQSQQNGAGSTGGAQRRLADEAEATARQLERLARERNDAQMGEAARRLQNAADAMRRASAQREGRGLADANAAREQLDQARRGLQQNQRESLQQQVDAARRRAEQLRDQQRANEAKDQLAAGVGELENRLDRLSATARGSNREVARQVQSAADAIRESRLRERIQSAQANAQLRSAEFNRAQDEQIGRELDRVAQQLSAASAAAGSQTAEGQSQAAGEQARRLAQGVQGMRGRMGEGAPPDAGRQLRAEARARAGELQQLRNTMQQRGLPTGNLDDALNALRSLQTDAPYGDPGEVDRLLAMVARGVENFEFDLRQANQDAEIRKLYLSSQGKVPAQFRKAVEDYYKALARSPRPTR